MSKPRRNTFSLPLDDTPFALKKRKAVPHEFVLDAIAQLSPRTRPMFGCLAVYVEDKIVLVLRDKVLRDKGEKKPQTTECGWPLPRSIIRAYALSSRTCARFRCSGRR